MLNKFSKPDTLLIETPRPKVPLPFIALAIGMISSYIPNLLRGGIGFNISYLGWIIPLLGCGWVVLKKPFSVTFPLGLWFLWAVWVVFYLLFATAEHALQRSVILLTPLVVGAGFSTLDVDEELIDTFRLWLNRFFWVFFAVATFGTRLVGLLDDLYVFAAGTITASILAVWYTVGYSAGERFALRRWAFLVLVPVLAVTRTGMVAVALTLPLTLAPLAIKKRLLVLVLLLAGGSVVFQLDRVQNKMFYSGSGTVSDAARGMTDLFSGNSQGSSGDFATSGRQAMSDELLAHMDEAYWFGHGANTTEAVTMAIGGLTHPHNDWLRVRYEYGMFGLLIFGFSMLAQMRHAQRRASLAPAGSSIFFYAGAGAFIPMAIFMFSDNVMLYAAWFGNLQFAMLGLGYAALRSMQPDGLQDDAL